MLHRVMIGGLVALALYGCGAPRQMVTPLANHQGLQVCILENPRVRSGFLDAYRKALEDRGLKPRVLPATARIDACATTSRYRAIWDMDLIPYLSYAEIVVYADSQPTGRAIYDARGGGLGKFADPGRTVAELVNQLFTK